MPSEPNRSALRPYFVGRTRELAALRDFFASPAPADKSRIAVITGVPGMGKTSLARRAAEELKSAFPDGLALCSARYGVFSARGGDSGLPGIYRDILAILGIEAGTDDDSVADTYLREVVRRQVLVVIDDAESVPGLNEVMPPGSLGGCIIVARDTPPGLRPGLALELTGLAADEAADLLVAYETPGPGGVGNEVNTVAAGNPLALNLILSMPGGGKALPELLGWAEKWGGGDSDRLQAVIKIAYDALSPGGRQALRLLSAFGRIGFTADLAAEIIALAAPAEPPADPPAAKDQLESLSAAYVLNRDEAGRYYFLQPIQEFARARLQSDENIETIRRVTEIAVRSVARQSLRTRPRLSVDKWTFRDTLNYERYARAITAFIQHQETRAPLSIAVVGRWGTGKTSLMRMIQDRLDPHDHATWEPGKLRLTAEGQQGGAARGGWRQRVSNFAVLAGRTRPDDTRKFAARPPAVTGGADGQPSARWNATVWFNPWKYEQTEQVWAGLATDIIAQVTERLPRADREAFWIALNRKRFDSERVRQLLYRVLFTRLVPWLVLAAFLLAAVVGVAVLGHLLPAALHFSVPTPAVAGGVVLAVVIPVIRAIGLLPGDAAKSLPFLAAPTSPATVLSSLSGQTLAGATRILEAGYSDPDYASKTGFLSVVHSDVTHVLSLVATEEQPLVVFIDDLDRCSASTVSRVIEAINLFLAGDYNNCIFVLGLDAAIVAAHIDSTYRPAANVLHAAVAGGAGWDFGWSFLAKFVQLPLILPRPGIDQLKGAYLSDLLDQPAGPGAGQAAGRGEVASGAGGPVSGAGGPVSGAGGLAGQESGAAALAHSSATDSETVARLELAMASLNPTPDTITQIAHEAEKEIFKRSDDVLRPQTLEAASNLFAKLYSDTMATPSIFKGLTLLESRSPREIKRYLNLFRFYLFLAEERRLEAEAISWDEVAKIAALMVKWPQFLGRLLADVGGSDVLGRLEEWIAEQADSDASGGPGGMPGRNWSISPEWFRLLHDCGLVKDGTGENENERRLAAQMYRFLSAAPPISRSAARLL